MSDEPTEVEKTEKLIKELEDWIGTLEYWDLEYWYINTEDLIDLIKEAITKLK
jgi:hypothetical protein